MPRDIERACGNLDAVYLYDIDDLQEIAAQNRAAREDQVAACRVLVDQATDRFMTWFGDNQGALRARATQAVTQSTGIAAPI